MIKKSVNHSAFYLTDIKSLHGKYVYHPILKKEIPVVCDKDLVEMEFGTGVVKVQMNIYSSNVILRFKRLHPPMIPMTMHVLVVTIFLLRAYLTKQES